MSPKTHVQYATDADKKMIPVGAWYLRFFTPFIRLTLFISKGSKSIKCSRLSYSILYYKPINTVSPFICLRISNLFPYLPNRPLAPSSSYCTMLKPTQNKLVMLLQLVKTSSAKEDEYVTWIVNALVKSVVK
jgi:hypothetical protein